MINRLTFLCSIMAAFTYCSGNNLRYHSSEDRPLANFPVTEISLEVRNASSREKVVCCYTEPPADLAKGCLFQSFVKEAVKDTQYDLTDPPEKTVRNIAEEFFRQNGVSVSPYSPNRLTIEIRDYELNLEGNNMHSVVRFRIVYGEQSILTLRGQEGFNMWGKSSMEETMAINISHLLEETDGTSLFTGK